MWDDTLSLWLLCGLAVAAYAAICHRASRIRTRQPGPDRATPKPPDRPQP